MYLYINVCYYQLRTGTYFNYIFQVKIQLFVTSLDLDPH
jgi:hypothetical protein